MGIIGKTQGVKSAAKPLKKDRKKITSNDFFPVFLSLFFINSILFSSCPFTFSELTFSSEIAIVSD